MEQKAKKQFRGEDLYFAYDVDPDLGGDEWDIVADWCVKNVARDDTFVDIGANVGFMSAIVGHFANPRSIIACEPDVRVLPYLKDNLISYCRNWSIVPQLILNETGLHDLYLNPSNPAQNSIFERDDFETSKITLPCTTLDEVLRERTGPFVLKIDAEFSEHLIWQGMQQILPKVKAMVIEYNPQFLSQLAGIDAHKFGLELTERFNVRDLNKNNLVLYKK